MLTSEITLTVFFYNPNIHPRREYELHKQENARFAERCGVPSSRRLRPKRLVRSGQGASGGAMVNLMRMAAEPIPTERLWVCPDCCLKTRPWQETEAALRNVVQARAIYVRKG